MHQKKKSTQRARDVNQKGNRTATSDRTDHLELRTSGRGQGTTGRDKPLQGDKGGGERAGTGPALPNMPRGRANTRKALHPPRQ